MLNLHIAKWINWIFQLSRSSFRTPPLHDDIIPFRMWESFLRPPNITIRSSLLSLSAHRFGNIYSKLEAVLALPDPAIVSACMVSCLWGARDKHIVMRQNLGRMVTARITRKEEGLGMWNWRNCDRGNEWRRWLIWWRIEKRDNLDVVCVGKFAVGLGFVGTCVSGRLTIQLGYRRI